jgi:hypothetical protein
MTNTVYTAHRNEYDVTDSIVVTDVESVRGHVCQLYTSTYGTGKNLALINQAFTDFALLFEGSYEGFHACDTLYHDMQHTLDVTLAMARLLNGYEREHPLDQLGENRFVLGCIIALFHDAGYIRTLNDHKAPNGAYYTLSHVSRGGDFLHHYLPTLGLGRYSDLAAKLIHFTGYEMDIDEIAVTDPKDRLLGHLLGTADLISQMADRCYLEKCRDRLYPEFVVCGLAGNSANDSVIHRHGTLFHSAEDLLKKTPDFYNHSVVHRLNRHFHKAYDYARAHFESHNPYMERISHNIGYLENINKKDMSTQLNRKPPKTRALQEFPFEMVG